MPSVVRLVNEQQPDVVLLVGDLTDGPVTELGEDLRPLADLRSPEGTYFVTGNHEFYFDPDGWLAFIPQLGIRVLANEGVPVRGLLLAGVHDIAGAPSGRGPDMDAALAARQPGQPVIMMSHSPNLVHDAVDREVELMVSGHTHGGQFYPVAWATAATAAVLTGLASVRRHPGLRHQRRRLLGSHRPTRSAAGHHHHRAALARDVRRSRRIDVEWLRRLKQARPAFPDMSRISVLSNWPDPFAQDTTRTALRSGITRMTCPA